jgi:Ca-activated chloride channel homolog
MVRRILLLLFTVLSAPAVANIACAQTPPSSTSPDPVRHQTAPPVSHPSGAQNKISVNSNLVVLPVTVKNQFGDLVPDLEESDFHIFDENVEQSIDIFTVEAFPLSLVVLIDDDLKSKDAAQMTPSLRAITAGISANDEALICRFDLDFHPGDAFSGDLDKLWADLKSVQEHSAPSTAGPVPFVTPPGSHAPGVGEPSQAAPVKSGSRPTKALDDAIHSAATLLHDRGPDRRKIILIVSDGVNGSQFNHFTYQDSLEALLHDNISVYSLAVGNSLIKKKFSRLIDYSNDSGGDIYYASSSANMEKLYSQITEEARHEYTLAYIPRGTPSISSYHKIEVQIDRPALTVKTRQGYYANTVPPSDPATSDRRK